jgi:hypothetical protein
MDIQQVGSSLTLNHDHTMQTRTIDLFRKYEAFNLKSSDSRVNVGLMPMYWAGEVTHKVDRRTEHDKKV